VGPGDVDQSLSEFISTETDDSNSCNSEEEYKHDNEAEKSNQSTQSTNSISTETDHYRYSPEPSAALEADSNTVSHTSSATSITSGAPDIAMIRLCRKAGDRQTPLGLGLVSGMHTKLQHNGVFVKTLVPGGLAAQDGNLRVGDRIAAVNGASIVALDYDQAIKLIRDSRRELRLLVIRARPEQAKLVLQPL